MANYGPPGGPYPGSSPEPWPRPDRESTDEYGQPADPWGGQDQFGGEQRWGGAPSSVPPGGPGSPVSHPGYPYQTPPGQPGHGYPDPGVGAGDGYPRSGAGDGYPGSGAGAPGPGQPQTGRYDAGYGPSPHHPAGTAGGPPGWTPPEPPESMWAPPAADANWSTAEPVPAPKRGAGRLVFGVVATLLVLTLGGIGLGIYLSNVDDSTPKVLPTTEPTDGVVGGEESPEPTEPVPTTPAPAPSTDARFVEAGQCVANEGSVERPKLVIAECGPETYEVLARIDERTTGDADAKAKCAKVKSYTNYYFFNSELDDLDFVLCLRER
ncbi:LppU/SCO3897 family protein [Plantactinospora sonchi]|uniref:Flagellar basal body protein FliL n=1 Tax=Plantactinospora sonchi TaxID=1544735 RepID=A0ABU7RPH3_9ACTN